MKRFLCCTTLIGIGAISAMFFLSMFNDNSNKEEIINHIDNTYEQPIVEETNENEQLKELSDKLDSMEEEIKEARESKPEVVIVEKEVEVPVYESTNNTVSNSNTTYLDRPFEEGVIKCEVCEQGDGDIEVWYDSNNHKHYSHTFRCTGALDSFYGPSVRGN